MIITPLDYVDDTKLGCWIDCSHQHFVQLNIDIINLAISCGMPIDMADWEEALSHENDWDPTDVSELSWIADDAIDWMNSNIDERYYFEIDDNSLYLRRTDEDE